MFTLRLFTHGFKSGVVGGRLTDLKIWWTARSGMIQLPRFQLKTYGKVVSYNELYSYFFKFY
jgi:hypothetical protein